MSAHDPGPVPTEQEVSNALRLLERAPDEALDQALRHTDLMLLWSEGEHSIQAVLANWLHLRPGWTPKRWNKQLSHVAQTKSTRSHPDFLPSLLADLRNREVHGINRLAFTCLVVSTHTETLPIEPAPREPQLEPEQFERIAETAAREDVVLEFINGRMGVKAVPDGNHEQIITWLSKRCMQHRPDLDHYTGMGLKVEKYRNGYARPDLTLAPEDSFAGKKDWADPDPVLMVVEVTSFDYDTDQRDRVEKPLGYAEAGIPVFLLIDRDEEKIVVHSNPVEGKYQTSPAYGFGDVIDLPVLGFPLDTGKLTDYISSPGRKRKRK